MGQTPSPYYPQQYPQNPGYYAPPPPPDPRVPAGRAAIVLIVVGALMLIAGTCIGAKFMSLSDEAFQQLIDSNPFYRKPPPLPPGTSLVQMMRTAYMAMSGTGILVGPLLLILGISVRGGARRPLMLAATVCGAYLIIEVISVMGACLGITVMAGIGCAGMLPFLLVVLAEIWLVQALKAARLLEMMNGQWNDAAPAPMQGYYQGPPLQGPAGGYSQGYGAASPGYGAMQAPPPAPPSPPSETPVKHAPLSDQQDPPAEG